MRRATIAVFLAIAAIAAFVLLGSPGGPQATLRIVSGSENRGLEPIIQDWAAQNRTTVEITYMGSVDISRELA